MRPETPGIDPLCLAAAVDALRRGEAIGLPTETVYGLAADAANPAAIRRLFALKGRPADHPVIVHLADAGALADWSRAPPPAARALAAAFWPGPLTLIVPRASGVSDLVTGGQDSVGLRVPSHPVARAVLAAFGGGLAAPSANRFGHVSPTTAQHVREEFGAAVPVVLDGGPCALGIESTIVDLTGPQARVLRPGHIRAEAIAEVLGAPLAPGPTLAAPRVPGSLPSHYAPRTPAELVPRERLPARLAAARRADERIALLTRGPLPAGLSGFDLPDAPPDYARHLYAALRALDAEGADRILIEAPPEEPAWAAVRDRLVRATAATPAEEVDAP